MRWALGRVLLGLVVVVLLLGLAGFAYFQKGRMDARDAAPALARRADALIAAGRGADALGAHHLAMLLAVNDPNFYHHHGLDLETPGAGKTTLTQSLAKRLAFAHFRPGLRKIRQTGYAMGLEDRLSKAQILALWLETVEMGRGSSGWMTGFFKATQEIYAEDPAQLSDEAFLRLIAVLIAPGQYHLTAPDPALDGRVERIQRLLAGQCRAQDNGDVCYRTCGPD